MLDVSKKSKTLRTARAQAEIRLRQDTIDLVRTNRSPKGDPFPVAKVAAIQAAKNTSQILPYCHPLPLDFVDCQFEIGEGTIVVRTEVKAIYKTGVEMEALTAASVAALTLYDMLKIVDETMQIQTIKLLSKTGGKSDFLSRFPESLRGAVLVMSDSVSAGRKADSSGQAILERFRELGIQAAEYRVIPDEPDLIEKELIRFADEMQLDLVMTTGGTGLSARDCAPEATRRVLDRLLPGISEAARAYGQERTPRAMLSAGVAGLRGKTLIVNLPGSERGVRESLDALWPALLHAFNMIRGAAHEPADEVKGR